MITEVENNPISESDSEMQDSEDEELDYVDDYVEENENISFESGNESENISFFQGVTTPRQQHDTSVIETVDSEVNFRVQLRSQVEVVDQQDMEAYIQKIIDARWEQKEKELLQKHGIGTGMENLQLSSRTPNKVNITNEDRIKSPSDTTLYAPTLNRTDQ